MELSILKNVKDPETINLRHAILGEQPKLLRGGTDKMGKGLQSRQNGAQPGQPRFNPSFII